MCFEGNCLGEYHSFVNELCWMQSLSPNKWLATDTSVEQPRDSITWIIPFPLSYPSLNVLDTGLILPVVGSCWTGDQGTTGQWMQFSNEIFLLDQVILYHKSKRWPGRLFSVPVSGTCLEKVPKMIISSRLKRSCITNANLKNDASPSFGSTMPYFLSKCFSNSSRTLHNRFVPLYKTGQVGVFAQDRKAILPLSPGYKMEQSWWSVTTVLFICAFRKQMGLRSHRGSIVFHQECRHSADVS